MKKRMFATGLIAAVILVGCSEPAPSVPPRQLEGSPFHYPEVLWDARVEGETLLRIHVSEEGAVDSARVEKTSGYAEFDSAAVAGARELRFEPARRGEEAVAIHVLLPVQFHRNDGDASAGVDSTAGPMETPEP